MAVRLFLLRIMVVIGLLGPCSQLLAEEAGETADTGSQRTLTAVLAAADYPPFYWKDNGKLTGISIDVLAYVAKRLDIRIEYRRLSWPRVLQALERGSVDMVTTFFNTAERAPYVVYTGVPHAYESNHFFALPGSNISYDGDLTKLSTFRIGTIKGYAYGEAFDQASYLLTEHVLDEPTLVRMVYGKRFDLGVGNPYAIKLEVKRHGYEPPLRFLSPPVDRSPIFMAFSRQNPDALALSIDFTRVIAQFKQTPAYQRLLERYEMDGQP
ncbi:transporter substrate-binding domain-containing protein [Marinobacteraceae bacterium S3BR75-40.1]